MVVRQLSNVCQAILRLSNCHIFITEMSSGCQAVVRYSRVPNITVVPNKNLGGNFFLKINKNSRRVTKQDVPYKDM